MFWITYLGSHSLGLGTRAEATGSPGEGQLMNTADSRFSFAWLSQETTENLPDGSAVQIKASLSKDKLLYAGIPSH